MGMLFGIHWDCIPEKNLKSEVRKLNVEGKVCVWVGWCATTTKDCFFDHGSNNDAHTKRPV
jgi:hypothetical protein